MSAATLFLVQMAGFAGMGKSTLARALARATGAAVVDLDVLKTAALDAGTDWALSARVAYEAQRAVASDLLRQGYSVILDSPCRFQRIVDEGLRIAAQHGALYGYVECHLSDEAELRRRLRARTTLRSQGPDLGVPPPDAPADAYTPFLDDAGVLTIPPSCHPSTPWIRVDTMQPLEGCLSLALDYLERLCTADTPG